MDNIFRKNFKYYFLDTTKIKTRMAKNKNNTSGSAAKTNNLQTKDNTNKVFAQYCNLI